MHRLFGISQPPVASWTSLLLCVLLGLSLPPVTIGAEENKELEKGYKQEIVRHEKAVEALRQGKTYLKDKSFDQARREFTQALKLDIGLVEARFCLGLVESASGNHKLALEHFKAVYDKDPATPDIRLEFTLTYLALGDCSAARLWLNRLIEHQGKSKETTKLERDISRCQRRQEK